MMTTRLAPLLSALAATTVGCAFIFGVDGPYEVECRSDADCASRVCATYRCAAPTCDDGVANGDEADVDCGGPACAPCADSRRCRTDADCAGGFCTVVHACCAPPCPLWSVGFGDDKDQIAGSVAADPAGNVLWTGSYHGLLQLGGDTLASKGASFDAFVAKLDPGGHVQWSHGFGDTEFDYGIAVASDPDGDVIVGGQFKGDVDFGGVKLSSAGGLDRYNIFVVKLGPAGDLVWARGFGDDHDSFLRGLAVDAAGNIVITGFFEGVIDFGGGKLSNAGLGDPVPSNDMYLAKLSSKGEHVYSRRFGGPGKQEANGLAVDGSGAAIVVGRFEQGIDFGDATAPLACGGDMDAFVAKIDAHGTTSWSRALGGAHYQDAESVAAGAQGDIVLTGSFYLELGSPTGALPLAESSSLDAFVLALDAGGGVRWVQAFGGAAEDSGYGVALDAAGDAVVTGLFEPGTMEIGGVPLSLDGPAQTKNVWLAKLRRDGSCAWAKAFATNSGDLPRVSVSPLGRTRLTGDYRRAVDFGLGALPLDTHASNSNVYLVEFAP